MPSILFYQGDRPIYEDEDEYLEYLELQYLEQEEENLKNNYWFAFYLFPIEWWNTQATSYCSVEEFELDPEPEIDELMF